MRLFLVILSAIMLCGCQTLEYNESYENLLNHARRPITVVSVSGPNADMPFVMFKDATGKLFTIYGPQFYTLEPGQAIY